MVKLQSSQEGFIQDWMDKRKQTSKDKWVNRSQVNSLADKVTEIDDSTISKLLDEKVLKKFSDCGYLMNYWFKVHFKLQQEVKRTIVPILKKYKSITKADLDVDYKYQAKEGKKGKIAELEESVSSAVTTLKQQEIYKKCEEFLRLVRQSDPTFRNIKLDKSRLKSLLDLYVKVDDMDYDKKCDGFIFAEDHDEGFWSIHYKLENLVSEYRTPSGADAEMEDFFGGFRLGIGTCMMCQSCYNKFQEDLNWIIKRICVLMNRYGII